MFVHMAPIIHEHVKQLVCETELARHPHKTKTKKEESKGQASGRAQRTLKQDHVIVKAINNAK